MGAIAIGCTNTSNDEDVLPDSSTDAVDDESPVGSTDAVDDESTAADPDETTPDASADGNTVEVDHAANLVALEALLPDDTRGVFAVDVAALVERESPDTVDALLAADGTDPALAQPFTALRRLTGAVDVPSVVTSAVLAQTTDATDGLFLLATTRVETPDELLADSTPVPDGTAGPESQEVYVDADGNHLTLLPGGVLVVGARPVVESVVEATEATREQDANAIAPFLDALSAESDLSFVYGLPALYADSATADRSLRAAAVMSGDISITGDTIGGELVFHTSNASEFVETYNALNQASTSGDDPREQPLTVGEPVAEGLGRVVVTVPPAPIQPSFDEAFTSRNIFKKLFPGMEALDYAEDVAERSEPAWLDFLVRSEADDETPPSPGSVYIRWKFRDQAAIDAFEENELPAGFRLAPTRFLEGDPADGEYFFALNIYNAGGGSIVTGTRAEWDVFVHPPDGADPDAGERPRFHVVDVLAEEVSADSRDLLTPAQPLSYELVDGAVVSNIARFDGDEEVPVFSATFPVPDPTEAEVARFTREMAIGNDYIYWAHGVSDRVLYNATTFNHDAYLVDTSQLTFTDDSRWAQYLEPTVQDAVYYVNDLEYVASPMANLDSEYLDISPEWLAELEAFTTNGHQSALMRTAVEQYFRGEADPFVGAHVSNETPSTYFNFEITDPQAMQAALGLPPGNTLAPTTLFEGGLPAHYLTLSVFETDDALEGMRAEWSVYVDDGSGRPPHLMIIDLMTADVAFDPVSILHLPSEVQHDVDDGRITTRLSSPTISFDASVDMARTTEHDLALDWIEAGDIVCRINDICDLHYYDAETLDVPVHQPDDVAVTTFSTPWDDHIDASPAVVFFRDNAQEYAVKRWYDLDVLVDELPFSGLADRTHAISGSGTLVGRGSDVADSVYAYTGDARVEGDRLSFAIDQEVDNALGVGHIFTTGNFDLTTGTGTQTVVDCIGPALLCSDIVNGSTAFFEVEALDATDPTTISWQVNLVLDLGGSFGTAESTSTFVATRTD